MEIKPDIKKAKERLEDLKKEIGKLINLNTIIRNSNELAYIIQIMNIYYEINNDILKNYEAKYRNYQLFQNIKEVYRVTRQGGQFIVINNYGDPAIDWEKKIPCMTRYTAEQICGFMNEAGFKDVRISKKDNLFCVAGRK